MQRSLVVVLLSLFYAATSSAGSCEDQWRPYVAQIAYVFVYAPGAMVSLPYRKLLQKYRPGGVLVYLGHNQAASFEDLKALNHTIRSFYQDSLPPLIGADTFLVHAPSGWGGKKRYGLGIAGKSYNRLALEVLKARVLVQGLAYRRTGFNHPLGPVLDDGVDARNPRMDLQSLQNKAAVRVLLELGLVPTLKHFPFLIQGVDSHQRFAPVEIPEDTLARILDNFDVPQRDSLVVMTTHAADPRVDGGAPATFSPTWIRRLRDRLGSRALIMTDGLFMMRPYSDRMARFANLPEEEVKTYFTDRKPWSSSGYHGQIAVQVIQAFARQAILAGHDLFFLEGDPRLGGAIIDGLTEEACSPQNLTLRVRIEESYRRLAQFKTRYEVSVQTTPVGR